MISMRTDLNPVVNIFQLVSGDLHAKSERIVIFQRTDKMEMKNTILNTCSIEKKKCDKILWITVCTAQWKFRKFKERKQINPTLSNSQSSIEIVVGPI